jgi:hypothetical protein
MVQPDSAGAPPGTREPDAQLEAAGTREPEEGTGDESKEKEKEGQPRPLSGKITGAIYSPFQHILHGQAVHLHTHSRILIETPRVCFRNKRSPGLNLAA